MTTLKASEIFDVEPERITEHNWFPLCSDINTHWSKTYHWWKCSNCKTETEHTKKSDIPKPDKNGCLATKKDSIYPLSSI